MEKLDIKVKRLQLLVITLVGINLFLLSSSFINVKDLRGKKFDEINVGRINIIDKHGVLKLAMSSNDHWKELRKNLKNPSFSGILFYNEEGQECGGISYDGKKTKHGQEASSGLMFDQFYQDQNVALQHNESIDSSETYVDDGLAIIQRPDYKKAKEEYKKYSEFEKLNLTQAQKDSLLSYYANQDVISARRLFVGTKRGIKNNQPFNETGLFIRNKAGDPSIRIYVDYNNIPHFEVFDAQGKKKVYELKLDDKNK